jgi:tetratricopeptide (TPR) repeat protein
MKIVLLFFILLNVHAQTDSKQREVFRQALRKARKLNLEGNYAQSNEYLEKIFKYKDRKINTPSVVLILVVDNYEKRGKYLSAIKYLNYYINRDYKVKHERILKAFEEDRLYPYAKAPNNCKKPMRKNRRFLLRCILLRSRTKSSLNTIFLKEKVIFTLNSVRSFQPISALRQLNLWPRLRISVVVEILKIIGKHPLRVWGSCFFLKT